MADWIVYGRTIKSYWDVNAKWRETTPPEHFSIFVSNVSTEDEAQDVARQRVQLSRGNIALIDRVRTVDYKALDVESKSTLDLSAPWWEQSIYAFDVETTGLSYDDDRIVEIGFSRYNLDLKAFEDPVSYFINDGVPIPQELLDKELNDITNETIADAPTFDELLRAGTFDKLLSTDNILISHNRGFDTGFLLATLKRTSFSYLPPVVCSMELALHTEIGQRNNKLAHLADLLGVSDGSQTHRAGDDAQMAGNVFFALARKNSFFRKPRDSGDLLHYFDCNPDYL